jgi:NAD(P)H dehydrogenase (quinone)
MNRIVLACAFLVALAPSAASPATVRLLVAYHSETGVTEKLAGAIRDGAASIEGVEVLLRKVADISDADIDAADGVLIGSPVHWGNMSAEAKRFIDRLGNTLYRSKAGGEGRTAGAFVTGGGEDGGKEIARQSIVSALIGMRFLIVGAVDEEGYGRLGAAAVVAPPAKTPTDAAMAAGRRFGERFARITKQVRPVLSR